MQISLACHEANTRTTSLISTLVERRVSKVTIKLIWLLLFSFFAVLTLHIISSRFLLLIIPPSGSLHDKRKVLLISIADCVPHDGIHKVYDYSLYYDACFYPESQPHIFIGAVHKWLINGIYLHFTPCEQHSQCYNGNSYGIHKAPNLEPICLFLSIISSVLNQTLSTRVTLKSMKKICDWHTLPHAVTTLSHHQLSSDHLPLKFGFPAVFHAKENFGEYEHTLIFLTHKVLLYFGCDFAVAHFSMFHDQIFKLQSLTQFLMDFPKF